MATIETSGQKSARTRKERGTDVIGTQKMVETRTNDGSFKTGAIKGADTCRQLGITTENGQKSLASRIANGTVTMAAAIESITKTWHIVNPEGESFVIRNLEQFCKEHQLDASTMGKVARGKYKAHKGWTCKQIDS